MHHSFAVFGNPIKHSQSPTIHAIFSEEMSISCSYEKIFVPDEQFEDIFLQFFTKQGGIGANITTPFKERAFFICDRVTKRASIAKSVNTVRKEIDGTLLGDNTDGIGLINDLNNLNIIKNKTRILLIGAGGAARGVIPSLLEVGCQVLLTNRTFSRAQLLVNEYSNLGRIISVPLCNLYSFDYNLIINATTIGLNGKINELPDFLITPDVNCYDMFYQYGDTPFINWCRNKGAKHCFDGLGMLIIQAAYSFFLWHNIFPKIIDIDKKIREKMKNDNDKINLN